MISKLVAASSLAAIAASSFLRPDPKLDTAEAVRAAYVQFVSGLNALSTSVALDVWPADLISRLQGFDLEGVAKAGLAKIDVQDVNVLSAGDRFAVLATRRVYRWMLDDGSEGPSLSDRAISILVADGTGAWRVTLQSLLAGDEKLECTPAAVDAVRVDLTAAIGSILEAMQRRDGDALRRHVIVASGHPLLGVIGRSLQEWTPGSVSVDALMVLAASDRTCVVRAEMTSRVVHGSARALGLLTNVLRPELLVFRRDADRAWKLDAELP
jgi:hypothetical protein